MPTKYQIQQENNALKAAIAALEDKYERMIEAVANRSGAQDGHDDGRRESKNSGENQSKNSDESDEDNGDERDEDNYDENADNIQLYHQSKLSPHLPFFSPSIGADIHHNWKKI